MTYKTNGPPPFEPVQGERILLLYEAHGEFQNHNANMETRKGSHVVVLEAPAWSRQVCLNKGTHNRARALVGRNTVTNRRIYISAYITGTEIQWLDRNKDCEYVPGGNSRQVAAISEEHDKLFTIRTQETKAGVVGQVVFEGAIVWESEPFPKGEFDSDNDYYPGDMAALDAAIEAKKKAVENLFTNA